MENQLIPAHYDAESVSQESQYEDNPHIFNNYYEYLLSIIGFAVGYGSFWRFPYLIYKNGGGVFLIPYFLALFILGIPILYLETAIGQMHRKSMPFIYQKINKGLKIVGMTYLCSCFHLAGYYNIILTYSYRFIFSAFNYHLPFANQSPAQNYYFSEIVLHKSNSINDFQSINPFLFILYVFSLYVCYQIVKKGVKSSGKIVVFTAILPYIFFLILFFRGIFLQGAGKGVAYLFQPKWSKLFGIQIWIDAIVQVFYQMTIAMSGLIHLASMKPKKQKFLAATYLIPFSLVLCGMLSALNVFMYLGHFTTQLGLEIKDLQLSGPQLSFNIFPKALAILPFPNFWVLLFFVSMIFLGIDSQFGYIQTIFCYLKDEFYKGTIIIFGKEITFQRAKQLLIGVILIFAPTLTSCAGIYYLQFYDSFTCTVPFSLGALIQLYTFVYFIPFSQLQNKVFKHTGQRVPYWIKWLLQGKLLIGVLLLNFSFACLNQFFFFFKYTLGFYLFGWFITSYPYVWAYIYYLRNKQQKFHLTFFQLKQRKYLHQ